MLNEIKQLITNKSFHFFLKIKYYKILNKIKLKRQKYNDKIISCRVNYIIFCQSFFWLFELQTGS